MNNNVIETETHSDSSTKVDTLSQKIKEKERAELRKEKKKALIGLTVMLIIGVLYFCAWSIGKGLSGLS
jgi:hypothetical protein